MNYLVKGIKTHQKTGSDLNAKQKKKVIASSAMSFKPNLINIRGNVVSNSIKKNFFGKNKKLIGIKTYIKTNNINENNTRDSNKKILLSEFKINEESKGDIDIYDENSTNNLTSTGVNNESLSYNSNNHFKKNLLSSSKDINISDSKNNDTNNNVIKRDINLKNYNAKINNGNRNIVNKVYNKKKSKDCLLVYKSQSNKEIKNNKSNDNINNHNNWSINNIEINSKNDITQRCRHKQVKREIYINNNINNKVNNIILNSMKKTKNNQISLENNKSNECENMQTESQSNSRASNKITKMPITKINKNNNNIKKQQQTLLELYANKNKSNKRPLKNNKKEINIENNNNEKNDFESKNNGCSKSNTTNNKIKRMKSSYQYLNSEKYEENLSKENINNLEIETTKTQYSHRRMNDNMRINKCKSINKINTEQNNSKNNEILNNNLNYTSNCKKRQFKRIKDIANYNNHNTEKNHKDNDICFDEEVLDENTLSVDNGKYIDNKKCQTMINKVLHFETGSNEIFNHFRTNNNINSINNMNFLIKNQSTKNMQDKKNSCNTIINGNYTNNNTNNNNIKNINIIIKNNIDYNLNRRKKMKNENTLKKCYTDIIMNNATTMNDKVNNNYEGLYYQQIDNDDIINQENYSSESNSNSININKNIINSNNKNLTMHRKIRYISYKNKKYLYKIFQCQKFINLLFDFCDINLLNKICLLSKQIYHFMKPIIYNKIEENIFKSNKIHKNLKIKNHLMEKFSPLSQLSPALIRKKYTDLKFENNHKYDIEIKKDLTRTFPDNVLFKYGNNYYNKLYHVLTAFSNYNKNIGYIQGLNFLAAHIIYFFDEEIDEFIFLDALIHKFDLEKILSTSNNNFFIKKLEDINKYIKQKMPKLSKYLIGMKLSYEFFTTNWLLTLFSNSMETKYLFIIWDYMIIFGWKFFKCFVVAVLREFQNEILKATQNNITFIMKNMLKNKQFNDNFQNIIKKTVQILIEENNII